MLNRWKTKIICISGKAQHGKDTAADIINLELTAKGYKTLVIHYADLLKYICKTYFGWNGEKDEFGRSLLQRVGTEVIRKQEPDYWVDELLKVLMFFPGEWDYVLIPDCRFPNEVIGPAKLYPSYSVRVIRDDPNWKTTLTEEQQNHISETALDDFHFDTVIHNRGTLEELTENIHHLVEAGEFE